ncbi:MAG: glucosamine-6-phosphate isomerase, partial [Bacteroidota bacterium]
MIRKISRIERADVDYTNVEKTFIERSGIEETSTTIPYIVVDNFPRLGLITSLRFLEWVSENPEGVISLPTGKTPEFFIKWTDYMLKNWGNKKGEEIREQFGLTVAKKPDLTRLQFVQIDEFYPINSKQHNSFYDYVNNF